MTREDGVTLAYLVGRLVGLLDKMGRVSLDEHLYYDSWHVRIQRNAHRKMENWNG